MTMIPVMQAKFTTPDQGIHGNCFAACVASLLELPLADVPAFEDAGKGWAQLLWDLLEQHGYTFQGTFWTNGADYWWQSLIRRSTGIDGCFIVEGDSPREYVTRGHAVIYQDGDMVHDPHPSRAGLKTIENVYMIERKSDG